MSKKLTHQEANYREPGLPNRNCGLCTMFRSTPKEHCTAVEDPIKWFGLCKIFERKSESKNAPPAAPLLLDALRRQAASTSEPLAKIEREIQAHRDALQLVKDFSFDFDKDEFAERVLVQRMAWTSIYDRTS